MLLGGALMLAGALLAIYNVAENARASADAAQAAEELGALLEREESADGAFIPDYLLDPTRDMPTQDVDGTAYIGLVSIPSLSIELPVAGEWSYETLKNAPCRYSGTAYRDGFVICAHNYRTHFGSLKNIRMGDEVIFTDVDGNEFRYTAVSVETLQPTAVEEMTDDGWALTLFTCTLGGRTRMTVRCERAE